MTKLVHKPTQVTVKSRQKQNKQKRVRKRSMVEFETARNNNDTRLVYSLIRQAYGLSSPTSMPMLSKEGLSTSMTAEVILIRWTVTVQKLDYKNAYLLFFKIVNRFKGVASNI